MNATDETKPATGAGESPRRLTRSSSDKVLTGLAGGLGRYTGVDPVVFRVAFVVLSFVGGTGILLYLAGSLLIPDETGASEADRLLKPRNRNVMLWILAIIGIGLFLDGFDDEFGGFPVGLALVGLGFAVLWSRREASRGGDGGSAPTTPPPDPSGTGTPPHVSLAKGTEEVAHDAPPPPAASAVKAEKPPKPPKPRSVLVPVTLSLLAILTGTMALFDVSVDVAIALGLLLTGAALVVGAWRGRARALIPVAVLLSIGLCLAAVVDVPLRGGAGERRHEPATVADIESPYRLAFGEMTLDLGDVDVPAGSSRVVVASVGMGALIVLVPRTAEVQVIAHAGLGQLDIAGQQWDGTDVNRRVTLTGAEGGGRLVVRADVGIGQVQVRRAVA